MKWKHYGEADAYGHRKKANVGEDLSEYIKSKVKEETVVSDPHLRPSQRQPDFIDKMVATTFGNMAIDAIHRARAA